MPYINEHTELRAVHSVARFKHTPLRNGFPRRSAFFGELHCYSDNRKECSTKNYVNRNQIYVLHITKTTQLGFVIHFSASVMTQICFKENTESPLGQRSSHTTSTYPRVRLSLLVRGVKRTNRNEGKFQIGKRSEDRSKIGVKNGSKWRSTEAPSLERLLHRSSPRCALEHV